ncbi:hypothetical protein PRZ48_005167 [Zasmidium cellare]|uniref:Amidase domain-containing protein n=1 Tax=Zasmidium cellare TaxID=395010 RepID=A0ABR0ESR0_ZASCE|nr:hypothetical protein PRZ48_005167 [Zasmidium cellare]
MESWQDRVADKKSRILASIPREFDHPELTHSLEDTASVQDVPQKYLSTTELEITALNASALVTAIREKKYTSVEVLNAFTHRAAIAHRLLHCCLALPYDLALARAKELDEHLEKTGETVGPLHGLAISVKDQCRLVGTETTCGFVYPIGSIDKDDAVVVKILKNAGANIFAKTSLNPALGITQSWDLAMECLDFRAAVLEQWNQTADAEKGLPPMDAYIAPVVPAVAPRHGDYSKVRYFAYTATVNLLDYTACTFPTGFVDPAKDLPDDASLVKDAAGESLPPPTCGRDETIRRKYDPEVYKGLPVCLQLVGRKLEEEKVVGMVKIIRDLLEQDKE